MESHKDPDLGYYYQFFLKWWWWLLLCSVCMAGAGYLVSLTMAPVYETTSMLIVGRSLQAPDVDENDVLASVQQAKLYAELVRSPSVLQATVSTLNLPMTWQGLQKSVSVELVRDTQLIKVGARDSSPERARRIADEVVQQMIVRSPGYRVSPPAQTEQGESVQAQLNALDTKLDVVQQRLSDLEGKLAGSETTGAADIVAQANALLAETYSWRSNYASLLNPATQSIASYLSVVEPAQLPSVPVSPKTMQNVLLGAVVGFIMASGAALVLDYLDDSIKSMDEISSQLGLAPLGAITRLKGNSYPQKVMTHSQFPNSVVEAYRMLRNNVAFAAQEHPLHTILVTSPGRREGKSVTAANLAVVMAQSGLRVILIDAHLRRPAQDRLFQLPNGSGLSTALMKTDASAKSFLRDTGVERLRILPSGPAISDPAGLFASTRMHQIIKTLRNEADIVIVDSPPVLSVADSSLMAGYLEATLLVTEAGRTSERDAKRALEQLRQAGANIVGGVLNRVRQTDGLGR